MINELNHIIYFIYYVELRIQCQVPQTNLCIQLVLILFQKKKLLTGYSSLLEKKQKNPNIDLIKWKEIQTVSKLNILSGIKILSEVSKV